MCICCQKIESSSTLASPQAFELMFLHHCHYLQDQVLELLHFVSSKTALFYYLMSASHILAVKHAHTIISYPNCMGTMHFHTFVEPILVYSLTIWSKAGHRTQNYKLSCKKHLLKIMSYPKKMEKMAIHSPALKSLAINSRRVSRM
jgi:hypothetical protein